MAEKGSKEWIEQYNKEVDAYNECHKSKWSRKHRQEYLRMHFGMPYGRVVYWWDGAYWCDGEYLGRD
ncbi:hypothetical protein NHP190012_16230 (plasmid) [Helicobacter sp. NHP19-012]|uniref:Uncharacterized protein n=1 Tax=Helicobacter gastrofelis TaxID=2849642 RepID=A0ABM7SGE5_9HELI|nr:MULTISPECIES: hypothetical protein [unclassified Helicobacter]BCZ19981.1 hypothetical protein NHP190012_16230 [Helicobacter sp. NHP19-012]GMB96749.1 hypothetical protein NHP22001_13380 [Helicobacter sp. NHP22-001]